MLPKRGRPASTNILMTISGAISAQDLLLLQSGAGAKTSAPMLQRLKARHQQAARAIASGRTLIEVATLTGYTPQRVGDLTRDPAFANLVAYYESQIKDSDIDAGIEFQERLKTTSRQALDLLQDRLEDDEKANAIPTSELRQIATMGLDRTVAPPKQAQAQITAPTKITFKMGNRDLTPRNPPTEHKILDNATGDVIETEIETEIEISAGGNSNDADNNSA